jgi:hypothetical protein
MAYVQSDVVADVGGGWWPDESDPDTLGTDQFLVHEADLGRGIRNRLLSEFLDMIFQNSTVQGIQVDPTPGNAHAIRSCEKVGFYDTATAMIPDGPARLVLDLIENGTPHHKESNESHRSSEPTPKPRRPLEFRAPCPDAAHGRSRRRFSGTPLPCHI